MSTQDEQALEHGDKRTRRARPLILVVEDDDGIREGLQDLLQGRFDVLTASTLQAGLGLAREQLPDVVLLDRFLPDGDGLSVLDELQRDPQTEGVAVIMLTADEEEATLEQCFTLGAADFLQKPFRSRELLARLGRALRQSEQRQVLQVLAQTDELTGLANYRALTLRLEEEFKRAARYRYSIAVVMIDLDHLKALNDGLGHDVGNRAIFALAEHLRSNLRKVDFAGRFGGDEFVVILPHQTAAEARIFAERIRASVRTVEVRRSDGRLAPFQLSVSAGVADHTPLAARRGASELLEAADAALYDAKRAGRDRVVVYEALPGRPELEQRH